MGKRFLRLIKKGRLVIRRDGLVNGLKRGYQVYQQSKIARYQAMPNVDYLTIKGMRYRRKGRLVELSLRPTPQVSVIIPIFNGLDFVRECIESLIESKVNPSYEIIAIDQYSQDGTRDLLKEYAKKADNFVLIENKENVGFARAINQGAALSRGKYIVIANSDLVFTPGWLDPLVNLAESNPNAGVISPMTNYVGEGPQVDPDAREVTPSTAADYAKKVVSRELFINVTDRLVFFCVLIRKNIFDILGGLASIYALGNYEDDDFCLRSRLAGYSLRIASNSFVFHHGSKTFKREKIVYEDVMVRNEKQFFQRVSEFSLGTPLFLQARYENPDITVIVRTKNRRNFLHQALTSLANQTYRKFEVVIVNDGEEDVTQLTDEYSGLMHINTVKQNLSKGRGNALNIGLNEVRGEWVTYLDDDDLVYPTHLENLISAVAQDKELKLVFVDANKSLCWIDDKHQLPVTIARERFAQQDFDYDTLMIDNWIPIMSFMHRLSDAENLGGFDESLEIFEDWDFLLRLTRVGRVIRVPRITCEYRLRFGKKPDDSTLSSREKARIYREMIYQRYPSSSKRVEEVRKATLDIVDYQIRTIRNLSSMHVSDLQKNYLISIALGGFKSVSDYLVVTSE